MRTIWVICGVVLILGTLLDGFETILLPRRINRRLRYSRIYYRGGWALWRRVAMWLPPARWRESMLSVFGPLSMLGLFTSWIGALIFAFAVLFWGMGSEVVVNGRDAGVKHFGTYLYLSGTNYFTLGLGDVTPLGRMARALTVVESGLGLGFLAVIISYLPVLYQAFSRREVTISLMDARAGSPPGAGELLVRLAGAGQLEGVEEMLGEWERWSAELLESHISFPALAYYRSQHANQSWLASLALVLDTCALRMALLRPAEVYRVQLTFAMARHAAVDIALIFGVKPKEAGGERLTGEDLKRLHERLRDAGAGSDESEGAAKRLVELRGMYEPILAALARHFRLGLPPMLAEEHAADNWQRSRWMPRTPGIGSLPAGMARGDHFD